MGDRPVRRITLDERRARLAIRHHLAPAARGSDVTEVARDLVGFHATDPATVYLAACARLVDGRVETVEKALYDQRLLVRMLGMRRTMFVLSTDLVPVVQAACTRAIAVNERRRTLQLLAEGGIAQDPARWLERTEARALEALHRRGPSTASELATAVPELGRQIAYGEGKKWAGVMGVSTRVLFGLASDGRIVRGRPRGTWLSNQYRWVPVESWLGGGIAELGTDAARTELARAWLRSFGPATAADLTWWTGWTVGVVKQALAALDVVEVDVDGAPGPGLVLADDVEPVASPGPWVALLPALDPTVMGWTHRDWYLGQHRPALFDTSGNAGPTVWCDGRIVGGWTLRPDGEVVVQLLEAVGEEAATAIDGAADRLGQWFGHVRVIPKFRTPLERQLSS
ncbi:MAG TPA: winged helix DNA-binding domain-containing protein [Acidimicrobiia bacterium]